MCKLQRCEKAHSSKYKWFGVMTHKRYVGQPGEEEQIKI